MAIYSHPVVINPLGQQTFGLVGWRGTYALSGYGLATFGFVWGIADIWIPIDNCEAVVWDDSPDACVDLVWEDSE